MTSDESPDDLGLGLGLDEPPQRERTTTATPYRVLARKYRPQNFDELIGQDAMVTTLANAIQRGRIAHAFLLTGVRGVGKTSTARLIAKALNCIGPDGSGGPTIKPCGMCEPCRSIAEGRHIDVIEMDAASHTGVDDVREIIDAVRYAAVSARFKIYIIDEVHMLSKNAFNALLKTLEEPPAHVKFLFATTEVDKVPVTVLSRCQRFDLRRIPADKLVTHFRGVALAEGVEVDDEALGVIARAAEGSARDGLSILDQAIAHGEGRVDAAQVRAMLGLADRARVRRLLETVLGGDSAATLAQLDEAHALGLDPKSLLRGLMESLHAVTRAKAGAAGDVLQSAEEREAANALAGKLGWATIHRLWQMLLKALGDVAQAPDPNEAAAMALLRLIHAADLPDPGELMRQVRGEGTAAQARPSAPAPRADSPTGDAPTTFLELVEMVERSGGQAIGFQLREQVGLVEFAAGRLVLRPLRPLGPDFTVELARRLKAATGQPWTVNLTEDGGEPSLAQLETMAEERVRADLLSEPGPAALLDAFPDAQLESINQKDR
ncbi:DNA polymerase III subunit gamma/tau [Sphingomonas mesophila]|uniref:DNA polymerase III subunit gamma/tau n=1 Tax=Sphingomonas mesophila TaxID=2303576 RepID=UPI000E57CBB6|nr:DNA polymerase III subunit gamma/tau [Sphingomonas mesophila]